MDQQDRRVKLGLQVQLEPQAIQDLLAQKVFQVLQEQKAFQAYQVLTV
jgi:hypothetical protein